MEPLKLRIRSVWIQTRCYSFLAVYHPLRTHVLPRRDFRFNFEYAISLCVVVDTYFYSNCKTCFTNALGTRHDVAAPFSTPGYAPSAHHHRRAQAEVASPQRGAQVGSRPHRCRCRSQGTLRTRRRLLPAWPPAPVQTQRPASSPCAVDGVRGALRAWPLPLRSSSRVAQWPPSVGARRPCRVSRRIWSRVRGGDGLHGGFFSFSFSALLTPLAHLRLHLQHSLLLRHRPVSEWAGDGQRDPAKESYVFSEAGSFSTRRAWVPTSAVVALPESARRSSRSLRSLLEERRHETWGCEGTQGTRP